MNNSFARIVTILIVLFAVPMAVILVQKESCPENPFQQLWE